MTLTATGFSNFATVSGLTPSVTLPSGIADNDFGVLLVHLNQTGTTTISAGFTGWTLAAGPVQAGGNNCLSWLYTKQLVSGDSSTVVSGTFSASGFWSIGGAVVKSGPVDQVSAVLSQTTLVLADNYASFTPVAADCMAIMLMGKSYVGAGGGGTATPASGWTELVDNATSGAASVQTGTYVAYKQLSGQAGTLQTSVAGTGTVTHRANSWVVTVKPPSATAVLAGDGALTAIGAPAMAGIAALSGGGALTAAGTPAVAGPAALSGAGSLTAAGTPGLTVSAALSGTGALTAVVAKPVKVWNYLTYWDGAAWVAKPVKVWNGSAWVQKPIKAWDGSAWVAH